MTMTIDVTAKLRRLHADFKIKNGDLLVTARKLRRAQDGERTLRIAALQEELDKIKQTIADVKRTIAELEESQA
jgi:phage protein D